MFKLHVEEGEQKGEEFALQEGDNLLGRSREAQIKLRSADVSSRHARLSVQGHNVFVANISQYGTWIGERKLQGDESLRLEVGHLIRAGKNSLSLQHIVQMSAEGVEQGQTAAPALQETVPMTQASVTNKTIVTRVPQPGFGKITPGADATVFEQADLSTDIEVSKDFDKLMRAKAELADLEETDGESSADKTRMQKTVFAPKEELERRLVEERNKSRQRLALIVGASILALVLLFLFLPKPVHEGKLEFDESYDIGETNAPLGDYKLLYPKNATSQVKSTADGLVITTQLGRKRDVRLVITLQESVSPKWATQDSETSVQEWMNSHPEQVFFGAPRGKFQGQQNGIWVWRVAYTRNNSEVVGEASVFFNGRRLEAISAEVPAIDQGRAEDMYKGCNYFEFPLDFEESCWLGQVVTGHVLSASLFSRIGQDLGREAPLTWAAIEKQLRVALSQSVAENDPADEEQAMHLLVSLRQQQARWFNSQHLLVINAGRTGDAKTVAEVAQRCQAVFSDQTDSRYFEVRKW